MITEIKKKKIFSNDVGYPFDKEKPTIILLHGSGQSHVVWSLTDQFLADKGFNVFTLDLQIYDFEIFPLIFPYTLVNMFL